MSSKAHEPTHCHLLTPPGIGAVAVIRVCGPEAVGVVSHMFRPRAGRGRGAPDVRRPGRLCYGQWVVDGETVDDVIVCAGQGADGLLRVDINAHGGLRVVERLLMSLRDRGVPLAGAEQALGHAWPAENEIDAEATGAVSRAKTRRAANFLMGQRAILPRYLAELAEKASADAEFVRQALGKLLDDAPAWRLLVEGATVAIVGPPNAGKSTLANRLFGAPMAIVSAAPGTTRDWVAEPTAIRGIPITLVDTPGLCAAADALEEQAIRRSLARWADADLKLVVLDGSAAWPAGFWERLEPMLLSRDPVVVVAKADLPRCWGEDRLPGPLREHVVAVSAHTGRGMDGLAERIVEAMSLAGRCDASPGLFSQRQRQVVGGLLSEAPLPAGELAGRIRRELIGLS